MIRLPWLALSGLLAASTAFAQVTFPGPVDSPGMALSAEVPLDPLAWVGGSVSNASAEPIVVTADQAFVVWLDPRIPYRRLYGTRIDATGNVLDRGGLLLASGVGTFGVTTDGTRHIAWYTTTNSLRFRSITTAGVVDPERTVGFNVERPSVSCNAQRCLAVTQWNYDVVGFRFTPTGATLDAAPFQIEPTLVDPSIPGLHVGTDGTDFLVAMHLPGGLEGVPTLGTYVRRVDAASAAVSGRVGVPVGGSLLRVEGLPGAYLVVGGYGPSRGARVSPAGALVDTTPFAFGTNLSAPSRRGSTFEVTWLTPAAASVNEVRVQTIPATGPASPFSVAGTVTGVERYGGSASSTQRTWVMLAGTARDTTDHLPLVTVITGPTSLTTPAPVRLVPNVERAPVMAVGPGHALIVWEDNRDRSDWTGLYAQRLDASWSPVGAPVRVVPPAFGDQEAPSVAWADGVYLVCWREYLSAGSRLPCVRLNAQGAVLDSTPLVLSSNVYATPGVGVVGSTFFVAWGSNTGNEMQLHRLRGTGGFLDPQPLTLPGPFNFIPERSPRILSDGATGNLLVEGYSNNLLQRLLPNGAPLGAPRPFIGGAPSINGSELAFAYPTNGGLGARQLFSDAGISNEVSFGVSAPELRVGAGAFDGRLHRWVWNKHRSAFSNPNQVVLGWWNPSAATTSIGGAAAWTETILAMHLAFAPTGSGVLVQQTPIENEVEWDRLLLRRVQTCPVTQRCVGFDAGVIDAGVIDAGVIDAGVIDAGVIDAGAIDAGVIDAGVIDAGVIDAGVIDAGVIDAGVIDAGVIDAGVIDAGVIDSGIPVGGGSASGFPDAGQGPGAPVSCGCGSGQGATSLVVALLVFVSVRRRRRQVSS